MGYLAASTPLINENTQQLLGIFEMRGLTETLHLTRGSSNQIREYFAELVAFVRDVQPIMSEAA